MQVYLLDAKLVDARRPKSMKLTNAQKEEHLLPYHPQVCLELFGHMKRGFMIVWLSVASFKVVQRLLPGDM
jgi:hypothetical protein